MYICNTNPLRTETVKTIAIDKAFLTVDLFNAHVVNAAACRAVAFHLTLIIASISTPTVSAARRSAFKVVIARVL